MEKLWGVVSTHVSTDHATPPTHPPNTLFGRSGADVFVPLFTSYLTTFPFRPQGAEAADRREARASDAAALKVPAAPWVEGRNPPQAEVGKVAGLTRAPAAAANQNTPPAAA